MDPLALIAAAAVHEEHDQTLFYVMGLIAAAWALIVSAIAIRKVEFPENRRQQALLMGITVVVVGLALGSAIITG